MIDDANEASRCRRLAERVQKRHRDHEDKCLWCNKPWPCADFNDASWALGDPVPPIGIAQHRQR